MTLRFKTDQNMPIEAAEFLRGAGLDCETVTEEGLNGAADDVIGARCKDEGRTLVTLDLDFSDIRAYPPEQYPAINSSGPQAEPGRNRRRAAASCRDV